MLDSLLANIFGNTDQYEAEKNRTARSPREEAQHASRLVPGQQKAATRTASRTPPRSAQRASQEKQEFSRATSLPTRGNSNFLHMTAPAPPFETATTIAPEVAVHQPALPQRPIMPRPQPSMRRSASGPLVPQATTADSWNWLTMRTLQNPEQGRSISPVSKLTSAESTNWPMMQTPQSPLHPRSMMMPPQLQPTHLQQQPMLQPMQQPMQQPTQQPMQQPMQQQSPMRLQQQSQPMLGAQWSAANMQNPNPPFGGNPIMRMLSQPQFPSSPSSGRLLNLPQGPLLQRPPINLPPPTFMPFPAAVEPASPSKLVEAEQQDRSVGQWDRKIGELTSRMAMLQQQIHTDPMIEQRVQETIDDIEHELDRDMWQSMAAPNAPTWQLEQQRASAEARAAQLQYLKQILESRDGTLPGCGTSAHETMASGRVHSPAARHVEPAHVFRQRTGSDPMMTDRSARASNAMHDGNILQKRIFEAQVAFEQLAESAQRNAAEIAAAHDNYYANETQERARSPNTHHTTSPPVVARQDGPQTQPRAVTVPSPDNAHDRRPSPASSLRGENIRNPRAAARVPSPPHSGAVEDLGPTRVMAVDHRNQSPHYPPGRTPSFSSSSGLLSRREAEFETRIAELEREISDVRRKQYDAFIESNSRVEELRRDLNNLARAGNEDPKLKADLMRQIVELEETNLKRRTLYNSHLKMLEDSKQSIATGAERPSASSHSLHSTDVAYNEMHTLLEMQAFLEDRLDKVARLQAEVIEARETGRSEDEIFALTSELRRLECEATDLESMVNAEKQRLEEAWRDCDESSKLCAQVTDMESAVKNLVQQKKEQEAILARERADRRQLTHEEQMHQGLNVQPELAQDVHLEKAKPRRLEDGYVQRQKELEAKPVQADQEQEANMQRDRDFYLGQIGVLETRLKEARDAKGHKQDDTVFKALEEQRQFVRAELEAKENIWQARMNEQQEQWMDKLRDRERELANDKSTMQSRILQLEDQLRHRNMDRERHVEEESTSHAPVSATLDQVSAANQHAASPPPPHAGTSMAVLPTQRSPFKDSPNHQPHVTSSAAASKSDNNVGVELWRRPDTSMLPERNLEYLVQVERGGWNSVHWENGYSLLHWCAKRGLTDICMYLVDLKADVGLVDTAGKNALDYARENGHYDLSASIDDVMRMERNQDGHAVGDTSDGLQQPPAQQAIPDQPHRRPDVSQLPPDNLAYLTQVENEGWDSVCWDNGYSLLHWCAKRGLTDLCLYLIELHADPEAQDNKGNSPADYAKMGGHHDLVRTFAILLQSDDEAPPGTQSLSREVDNTVNLDRSWDVPRGDTRPAQRMSSREFLTVGTQDLRLGDSQGRESHGGLSDSHGAIDVGDVPEPFASAISLMEEQGWANMRWTNGFTLLHWAARGGRAPLVKYFLEMSADLNARDVRGKCALDYAQERDHLGVIRLLENAAASPSF